MTTSTAHRRSAATPTRFREAEERGRRLGRGLRMVARIDRVDEDLMARIGAAYWEQDDLGAELAQAIRRRPKDPERVTHATFAAALRDGVEDDAPAALRTFVETLAAPPAWLDRDLLAHGQRVYHRLGQNAADVLMQLSLIGGFRFGGPPDLLVATGGLIGDSTVRRLAETQKWAAALSTPGGLEPYGEAWRLTVHVRAMHALVNHIFTPQWDVERWGLPINQADQAGTLGLFDAVVLLGSRGLGVRISRRESDAVMHMWKYVGWLMGVDEDFLVDSERERHRINYHILLAQAGVSEAGPPLSQAIVEAQRNLHFENLPRLRGWFERERSLSMLTVLLGLDSMRELGLPLRPPWAPAYLVLLNTWRYRTPWGRRGLDAWGDRVRERVFSRYFGAETHAVGELPD